MIKDVERILLSEEKIEQTVQSLADKISADYAGKKLLLLGILKGSVVFMGDLMKHLTIPVQIDFMRVSSYGHGTVSSGRVNIILDLFRNDIGECDILVVEDIIDSGKTLSYFVKLLRKKNPASVKICAFLDKKERREVDIKADYVGFDIPCGFVIGYGLDYAEKYREFPFLAEITELDAQ